jgi:hypothetical protein
MKRKLIDYNTFHKIKTESTSSAQIEVENASEFLARALEVEGLEISSFSPDNVLFETTDGEFVHANYKINNGYVQFDNIEQLVINEETEKAKSKEIISKMIDSLIESNDQEANDLFSEWMDLPLSKRIFTEARVRRSVPIRKVVNGKEKIVGHKQGMWSNKAHTHQSSSVKRKRAIGRKKAEAKRSDSTKKVWAMQSLRINKALGKGTKRTGKKKMCEWNVIAENVLNYVDFNLNGPALDQCQVIKKDGAIVAARVPTAKLRNEAKLLKFNWNTMNTDVVVKRSNSKKIHENNEFAKEIADLKRVNALSDNEAVEESIERISTTFPEVIYLTESELTARVKAALESVGATNYDDETCRFISEGLLRTIHENFSERVEKIVRLAGGRINEEAVDKYTEFKNIVEAYYKKLDESTALEMQAFVDVYEALREIHEVAKSESNEEVAEETASHLDGLLPMVRGESELNIEVLGEAAEWLYDILEGTMESEEWKTSEPVVSATGEHPEIAKKGRFSQSPADMEGNTPGAHYTSDGKDYKGSAASELEGEGWSNLGGEGVYPSLENPYVPQADMPKIVGEKDVDSDSDQLAHWSDNDTWPGLQNPYSKASVTPKEAK